MGLVSALNLHLSIRGKISFYLDIYKKKKEEEDTHFPVKKVGPRPSTLEITPVLIKFTSTNKPHDRIPSKEELKRKNVDRLPYKRI